VIANPLSVLVTGLVGRYVQSLIYLARVGDHDLAVEPQREVESELRFPDAGRTDDDGYGLQ